MRNLYERRGPLLSRMEACKNTTASKKRTNIFQDYGVSEDGGMEEEDHYFPN